MALPLRARKVGPLAFALALACAGCGDEGGSPVAPPTAHLDLHFDHTVGGQDLAFDVRRYTNAAGNRYDISQLRYLVSDAALVREDGSVLALGEVHRRDARDPTTRTWSFDGVAAGSYSALRFRFGLDATRNVTGSLPEYGDMSWPGPWGGGYHFMILDGRYEADGGGLAGWAAHLGRLQRDIDPVPFDHDFEVELALGAVAITSGSTSLQVVMDVDRWFASPNVYDFRVFGGMMMDNPEAQSQLVENGAHVFAIGGITTPSR
jgi:hypothetical protein